MNIQNKRKVAVMTDSNSGIREGQMEGVYVLPMPVVIDGQTYYENVDITPEEFYRQQQAGVAISTSQPSPAEMLEMWEQLLKPYDEVVYIPMSSGLSGTCQTAMALAASFGPRIQVIDNGRISVTQLISVQEAKAMVEEGYSAAEIKAELEAHAEDAAIYITVDTLEYLKKGGRITPVAAAFGTILNIKPILSLKREKLEPYAKAHGKKAAFRQMMAAIQHELDTKFSAAAQDGTVLLGMATTQMPTEEQEQWLAAFQA